MLTLRPPSPELQERLRELIAEAPASDHPGDWPRRLAKERGVLLLHGSAAYLYFLGPGGEVSSVDTDSVALRMEPETGPYAVNAVAQAARQLPVLRDLLPGRPSGARDCPTCQGSGDEGQFGPCGCSGLGWVLP